MSGVALSGGISRRLHVTRLTRKAKILRGVLGAALLFVFAEGAYLGDKDVAFYTTLEHGKTVYGKILNDTSFGGRVSFTYPTPYGPLYGNSKWSEIPPEGWAMINDHGEIPVTYLPESPTVYAAGPDTSKTIRHHQLRWAVITMLFGLLIEALAYCVRRATNRERRLLATATVIPATVRRHENSSGKSVLGPKYAAYEYRTPNGELHKQTLIVSSSELRRLLAAPSTYVLIPENGPPKLLPLCSYVEAKRL